MTSESIFILPRNTKIAIAPEILRGYYSGSLCTKNRILLNSWLHALLRITNAISMRRSHLDAHGETLKFSRWHVWRSHRIRAHSIFNVSRAINWAGHVCISMGLCSDFTLFKKFQKEMHFPISMIKICKLGRDNYFQKLRDEKRSLLHLHGVLEMKFALK